MRIKYFSSIDELLLLFVFISFYAFSYPLLHFSNLEYLLKDQLPIEYVNSNKCQYHATNSLENDSIFIVFVELKAIHECLVIFLKCNWISLQVFCKRAFNFLFVYWFMSRRKLCRVYGLECKNNCYLNTQLKIYDVAQEQNY